jgi:multiple antibiotic resistance protein
MHYTEYLKFFTALLAILNPIGAIPVFVGMTQEMSVPERRRVARTAAVSVFILLIVSSVLGEAILHLFGISIASFRVGGGILILLIAISMLNAQHPGSKHSPEEAQEAATKDNIAVVPLAIPLLAGPGSISTVIIFSNRIAEPMDWACMLASILLVGLVVWLALTAAIPVGKLIGRTGINIASRIMGLLLSAIAIEFIAAGLLQLMPGLSAGHL